MESVRPNNPLPPFQGSCGPKHGTYPLCGCGGEAPILAYEKEQAAKAQVEEAADAA